MLENSKVAAGLAATRTMNAGSEERQLPRGTGWPPFEIYAASGSNHAGVGIFVRGFQRDLPLFKNNAGLASLGCNTNADALPETGWLDSSGQHQGWSIYAYGVPLP